MNEHDDRQAGDDFAERASALFDDSVQALDGRTRSRLNKGRQQAIAAAGRKPLYARPLTWAPVGATAAVAALAIVMMTGNEVPDGFAPPSVASDFEILMDDADLEMLEDLEFYSWMGTDDITGENVG